MIQPLFTADRSLAPLSTVYAASGRVAAVPLGVVQAACSGVECHSTYETCCCPTKCVISTNGERCHCEDVMLEAF